MWLDDLSDEDIDRLYEEWLDTEEGKKDRDIESLKEDFPMLNDPSE